MKYEIELPVDVEQRLAAKASQTGEDVEHLIRLAVAQFIELARAEQPNGHWSDAAEERRRQLIDRDIAGTITGPERAELAHLDRLANEHFDRVAPPPADGARRLHRQLLKKRASHK